MRLSRSPASMRLLKRFNSSWNGFSTGISHMGSLQAQRAIQTRWWHHSQVLQGQSNSGLSLVGVELDYECGGSWGLFPQSIPR